jgi:S-adenosylmethionine/arginine decarboxylase-like enzyme
MMNLKATAAVIEQLREEVKSNKEAIRRERVLDEENAESLMGDVVEDSAMDVKEFEISDFATFGKTEPVKYSEGHSSMHTHNPITNTL